MLDGLATFTCVATFTCDFSSSSFEDGENLEVDQNKSRVNF